MINQKLIQEIGEKLSDIIAASPAKDIEKNVKAMMTATFSRLDLVTREEFEVQQEILIHTREQLEQVRSRLEKLENQLHTAQSDSPEN